MTRMFSALRTLRVRLVWISIATAVLFGCTSMAGKSKIEDAKSAADVHTRLAWNYLQRGQFRIAETEVERALELDSRSSRAHHVKGLLHIQLAESDAAEKSLAAAVRYDEDNLDAVQDYASFLCDKAQFDKAIAGYRVALTNRLNSNPEITMARAGLCLLSKPDLDGAEEYLRQALRARPSMPMALSAMAQLSYQRDDFMRARAYLERYHDTSPATAQTLAWGLMIESRLGDEKMAHDYGQRLKTQFPESPQARQYARTGTLAEGG